MQVAIATTAGMTAASASATHAADPIDWQAAVMDPIGSGGIALTNGIEMVVR